MDTLDQYHKMVHYIQSTATELLSNQEPGSKLSAESLTHNLKGPHNLNFEAIHSQLLQQGMIVGNKEFDLGSIVKLAMTGAKGRRFIGEEVDGEQYYILSPEIRSRY